MEQVILVDKTDNEIGVMEKMETHEKALLHRAFSVFIFNSKGEMLLQQRAFSKYHSGGLWTNSCCSHPRPNENTLAAAERRLFEELGFSTTLHKIFDFTYKAEFDNGLVEHEFDHVYYGLYNGPIEMNQFEVCNVSYKKMEEIRDALQVHPEKYTVWFQLAFPKVYEWFNNSSL
ncbi:MAG: isopentenyl-diphosphate Delta-isomerase [Bacteroidota bacterium]|nr:isopentenyl-diphosphate Delta-isomerase [Bacteroidota bacterium]